MGPGEFVDHLASCIGHLTARLRQLLPCSILEEMQLKRSQHPASRLEDLTWIAAKLVSQPEPFIVWTKCTEIRVDQDAGEWLDTEAEFKEKLACDKEELENMLQRMRTLQISDRLRL